MATFYLFPENLAEETETVPGEASRGPDCVGWQGKRIGPSPYHCILAEVLSRNVPRYVGLVSHNALEGCTSCRIS